MRKLILVLKCELVNKTWNLNRISTESFSYADQINCAEKREKVSNNHLKKKMNEAFQRMFQE